MLTNSTLFLHPPTIAHNSIPKINSSYAYAHNSSRNISPPMHSGNVLFICTGARRRTAGARGARNAAPAPEEHGALETVLKLYEAIKNKNVNGVSDIVAEECSCISNFVSSFQPYLGKKVRTYVHGYYEKD